MEGRSILLSDGRSLGFQCLGDNAGSPVFFFHGTPGSRLVLSPNDAIAQIPGIRLVLPDRPGYGISDAKPGRTLLDWPDDVRELADYLGLDTFAVAGESGGGPHALACAYRLDDRLTKTLLFASPSPAGIRSVTRGMSAGNRLAVFLARRAPRLARWTLRGYASAFAKNPQRFLDALAKQMAPC